MKSLYLWCKGSHCVLFIGRLASYKRLDWLLEALSALRSPWRLSVVGGPNRRRFEDLAQKLFVSQLREDPKLVQFHGRLTELEKQAQIVASDVLVLPSDCSNEAWHRPVGGDGGRPGALAFDQPRSGMGWVEQLSDCRGRRLQGWLRCCSCWRISLRYET